jgi:hypothetical protein
MRAPKRRHAGTSDGVPDVHTRTLAELAAGGEEASRVHGSTADAAAMVASAIA